MPMRLHQTVRADPDVVLLAAVFHQMNEVVKRARRWKQPLSIGASVENVIDAVFLQDTRFSWHAGVSRVRFLSASASRVPSPSSAAASGTEVAGGDGGHWRGRRSPKGTEVTGGDGGRWRGRRLLAGTEVTSGDGGYRRGRRLLA